MTATSDAACRDLIRELCRSKPLERLGFVSFLGAIDWFDGRPARSGSRLDHTIGVASLTQRIANMLGYDEDKALFCVAVAMLHDIGHPVFSHSGEEILKKRFGVSHHDMMISIIDESSDVARVVSDFGFKIDDIRDFFNGNNEIKYDFCRIIFDNRMNPDTIEGIIRAARYFGESLDYKMIDRLISFAAIPCKSNMDAADYFWVLKDNIYNRYIYNSKYSTMDDEILKMFDRSPFEICDLYEMNEEEFLRIHSRGFANLGCEPSRKGRRRFIINRNVCIDGRDDVRNRYLVVEGLRNEFRRFWKHKSSRGKFQGYYFSAR